MKAQEILGLHLRSEGKTKVIELPSDDSFAPIFTVGQVSSFLNIQPAFLRRLDTEQVIQPARSEGGQRRYSRNDITQVQRVVELIDDGLTLAGIVRVFTLEEQVHQLQTQLAVERERRKVAESAR